jgi:hypothetical protein
MFRGPAGGNELQVSPSVSSASPSRSPKQPLADAEASAQLNRVTTEDLDCIDRALSLLLIHDGYSAEAKSAALRFNSRIQQERSRFEGARAMHEQGRAVSPDVEIELRASAVMYTVERERIVRLWKIPLRAPVHARGDGDRAGSAVAAARASGQTISGNQPAR